MNMKHYVTLTLPTVFTTFRNRPLIFSLLVIGLLFVSGCSQSLESARKELAALKKDFTAADFFVSAREGDKTAVALFLKVGMDANATGENSLTALIAATANKHPEIVKLLLENGAKPNTKHNFGDQRGFTPLLAGIAVKMPEIVEMLLNKGADPNL